MKLKIFLIILLVSVLFAQMAEGRTMTDAQRQALIVQLQQQIVQLQTQLIQMLIQQRGGVWCHTFNTNFGFASPDTIEVINLHLALQREGISYGSDAINVYSTGTAQAVAQFQAKYGISEREYVGPLTRAKLNQLYGCRPVSVYPTCVPNWQTGSWGACISGQQTRTVWDLNNCGVETNKPAVTQPCSLKPIDIKANGSDGPVNLFLTLNSGASVSTSGIVLSKSINLEWMGAGVASCLASDSAKPPVFSGYKPVSGSQTVTLSGTIKAVPSPGSKVSDTFRMNCVLVGSGNRVSDSVTVNLFYTVASNCIPNWQCTPWSACSGNKQTRTCIDYNGCGSLERKPAESQSCVPLPM